MARPNFNQPSTMSQQMKFSKVPQTNIQRSRMDRSHGLKTSFGGLNMPSFTAGTSVLTPIYVDEVLPGDSFHMKSTAFARLATPLHPIMDNLSLDTHYFFVPYRLVWEDWQRFMGERDDPDDDPNDFTVPTCSFIVGTEGSSPANEAQLSYYMGLPMTGDSEQPESGCSTLPFRAYRLIWNEWYRDENIQDSVPVNKTSTNDSSQYSSEMLPRGKRKDYFTGALPWPQKGDPVMIPVDLMGSIPVYGNPNDSSTSVNTTTGADGAYQAPFLQDSSGEFNVRAGRWDGSSFGNDSWIDVSNAATINDLRTAFQIQKLLERDARGGTRYTELILSHFGVHSPDARLQRPEYLGGGTSRVNANPVANTTDAGGDNAPQGNLAAYGTSVNEATFSKSFTEHGIIIGLVSYRADLTYQRGIERFWSRRTRYDFFWPTLAHLGEQAILNKEIHFRNEDSDDDVFAYQERYAEYRFKPSRTTGLFNSDAANSLDVWHLAQDFDVGEPLPFNEDFIMEFPPIDRIIAVPTEPWFIMDVWFDLICDRPMPIYAVPGMVDHF